MCPVNALRVAYTGELGWELHHPIEMQNYLFDRLMEAGEPLGLKLVGARAQNWLRQEKSYRAFGTELGRDATPLEADLPRFVDLSKDFRGKAAMQATGIRSLCVTLLIDGPDDADPWGREALYAGGEKVGRLTSGGYSVAFGEVDRHGLRPPRPREARHPPRGQDAGPPLAGRDHRRQPLRPGERPHPRRRIAEVVRAEVLANRLIFRSQFQPFQGERAIQTLTSREPAPAARASGRSRWRFSIPGSRGSGRHKDTAVAAVRLTEGRVGPAEGRDLRDYHAGTPRPIGLAGDCPSIASDRLRTRASVSSPSRSSSPRSRSTRDASPRPGT